MGKEGKEWVSVQFFDCFPWAAALPLGFAKAEDYGDVLRPRL
jgi:hypothetical protein